MKMPSSVWGGYLLAFAVLLSLSEIYGQNSLMLSASPTYDGCYYYTFLTESNRNVMSSSSYYCDSHLDGWYRFAGSAGNSLLDECPLNHRGGGNDYCGAQFGGWVHGRKPHYYEGVVKRTVYFANYYHCYADSISIWMRNCGSYYVYYFHRGSMRCNYRFCGSPNGQSTSIAFTSTADLMLRPTPTPTPTGNPCYSYKYLSDATRIVGNGSPQSFCDHGLSGWYRFGGMAGSKMLDQCPAYYGSYWCGTSYGGWMYGQEPSWYEGVVQRTVYFATNYDCYWRSKKVFVRNCGGFLVYYLTHDYSLPCNYRYCGMRYQTLVTSIPASSMYSPELISPSPSISSSAMMETSSIEVITQKPPLDACKYYQVLSDSSRAGSNTKWGSFKCDEHLNGWYRFMGDAGNKMLDECPSRNGGTCGARWQGWLLDSRYPEVHDGEQYRTVCISNFYTCYCSYYRFIKVRNCGKFYVYKLDGVPLCNTRYCGAKEKTSRVDCSSNYMRVTLDAKYFDESKFSSITLRDPSCTAFVSKSFITLGSVPNGCGALREETKYHIVYRNEVILTAKQSGDSITRDHDQTISVSCTYDREGYGTGASYDPIRRVNGNESGFGAFTFGLEMYRNRLYREKLNSYPAKVKLRDYLYFEATASVQDNNLVLLLDQCYTSPDMRRNHISGRYRLIDNGCPVDSTVQFLPASGQKQRFTMQAFRYLRNSSAVYVHCAFFLCQKTSSDYRCQAGCSGNNVRRVKRDAGTQPSKESFTKYYLLEAGPIVREYEPPTDKKNQEKPKQALQNIVMGLVAGVIVLALVVVGLVVRMLRRGKGAANGKEEETNDIGIDNAKNGEVYVNEDEPAPDNESSM